jgi:N-acetylglucosamine-6-phosphate deacetylase
VTAADTVVAAGSLVTPDGVLTPGWAQVRNGVLTGVGAGLPPRPADRALPHGWLLPGFVDMHVHGGGGASLTTGRLEDVVAATALHRAHGTTTMVASLVTAAPAVLEASVRALADLVDDGLLAGIHLEGPWLAAARAGAHDARLLRDPAPADVHRLLAAGRGAVRVVTLAPELPGGLAAVRQIVEAGAVAAVGHTAADYDTTARAVEAGAGLATHLFNAMPPLHHRAPGPVAALLEADEVAVELVLDGAHLHPAMAALAAQRVGGRRTVLVTDAIAAAGAGDGRHRLGGLDVTVTDGIARLTGTDVLAGSTLTMDGAWLTAVASCGLTPHQATLAASTNPARLLGLASVTGALVPGLRADLVLLDRSLHVAGVMAAGRWCS